MSSFLVRPAVSLKGEIALSGDKSIAHRSVIISSLTQGKTVIDNFPANEDCLHTIKVFNKLGVNIKPAGPGSSGGLPEIIVSGRGLYNLNRPKGSLFVGESGTTLRLILGVLSGQGFRVRLKGAKSLSLRPMLRVTEPLRSMGARIYAIRKTQYAKQEEYPPITIQGGKLRPITYRMPVASAQVKSAILLAGLYVHGVTSVIEPIRSRDHTERMLRAFGADIKVKANKIFIKGAKDLISPGRIYIPGDISSASFFIVAASILANSNILIKDTSLNPLRIGIIQVLKRMGADIKITKSATSNSTGYEPMGNISVRGASLKGTIVKPKEIPSLIDELPILMVAACFARGKTIIEGAGELRLKETDRINSMFSGLKKMGARVMIGKGKSREKIIIEGTKHLVGKRVRGFGDHRTVMSLVVAGLRAEGETVIDDIDCIKKSFPEFFRTLNRVTVT